MRRPRAETCYEIDGPGRGYRFEEHAGNWGDLPDGMTLFVIADVVVDGDSGVHVFTRGPHGVVVFDASGRFLYNWGERVFQRPHGATLGSDGRARAGLSGSADGDACRDGRGRGAHGQAVRSGGEWVHDRGKVLKSAEDECPEQRKTP